MNAKYKLDNSKDPEDKWSNCRWYHELEDQIPTFADRCNTKLSALLSEGATLLKKRVDQVNFHDALVTIAKAHGNNNSVRSDLGTLAVDIDIIIRIYEAVILWREEEGKFWQKVEMDRVLGDDGLPKWMDKTEENKAMFKAKKPEDFDDGKHVKWIEKCKASAKEWQDKLSVVLEERHKFPRTE